jgi:tyrosinase
VSNNVRVRRSVWSLPAWDEALVWYAKAVAVMQSRPIADPTSWRYQAAIHGYDPGLDPLATPGEALPSDAEQTKYWSQCQHGTWFFLPWHRMYLAYFEAIVAAAVVEAGGPTGWALPYWNYSDAANPDNARRLPRAFRDAQTPDGDANPLRVQARTNAANNGDRIALDHHVDLGCLLEDVYRGELGGAPGFGGVKDGFNHGGDGPGAVEITPHGDIHVRVGGSFPVPGWMSSFETAALDPIFWLHHANIDRLWEVWRRRPSGHANPRDRAWRTLKFNFHDAQGSEVTLTPGQVVNTTASLLGYEYDDVSDPLPGPVGPVGAAPGGPGMPDRRIPEMVGATAEPVVLTGQPTTARFSVSAPTGPGALGAAGGAPARLYLNIENVTAAGTPIAHVAYLNLPPGADPAQHPELIIGTLPMFGVSEASRTGGRHPGSGLRYALDATNVVGRLTAQGAWDPNDVRVTLVPEYPDGAPPAAVGAAPPEPIRIGRISLYQA